MVGGDVDEMTGRVHLPNPVREVLDGSRVTAVGVVGMILAKFDARQANQINHYPWADLTQQFSGSASVGKVDRHIGTLCSGMCDKLVIVLLEVRNQGPSKESGGAGN